MEMAKYFLTVAKVLYMCPILIMLYVLNIEKYNSWRKLLRTFCIVAVKWLPEPKLSRHFLVLNDQL